MASSHNQSPAERTPVQFTLRSLLLSFVLVWASLALFGLWGILVAAYLLVVVISIRRCRLGYRHAFDLLAVATIPVVLVALLWPALPSAREPARRACCLNNLKQIGLALQDYHSVHGRFPPAYIADEDGKPMHSWRVLILPFLECKPLYDQYDFSEPWNGPNNRKLASELGGWLMKYQYQCPSDPNSPLPYTNYVAVVGPGTAWPGAEQVTMNDVRDGTANTIMVVEVTGDEKFHWMEPRDLTWDDIGHGMEPESGPGISSKHLYDEGFFMHAEIAGACVALADGFVKFLPAGQDPETLRALLTIDGGEDVDPDDLEPKYKNRPHWSRITALYVLLVSFALLLFWPLRKCTDGAGDREYSALSDEELTAIADERFQELDNREAEDPEN